MEDSLSHLDDLLLPIQSSMKLSIQFNLLIFTVNLRKGKELDLSV